MKTSDRFTVPKSACHPTSFQGGGNQSSKGPDPERKLGGEVGLKRHLSVGPNSPTSPEVPQVQV